MLTVETFAEVVAFLRLFDLNALVVTNALCSSLAAKTSTVLRREEFPGLLFEIWNKVINVFRCFDTRNDKYGSFRLQFVAGLSFPTANDMIEFIDAAFPRCIFEHVTIYWSADKHVLDTIARVADCVVVNGILHLTDYTTPMSPSILH
ncbi:hypothetical protein AAVH_24840 [Aphelenchoides avenae]|nr:hypothetical protein AAVH_24840 [Aphelenchus avenae]